MRKSIVDLFLVVVFPSHLWVIFRALTRGGSVQQQFGTVGFVGYIAYELQFALIETGLITVLLIALCFLLPWGWSYVRRLSVLVASYSYIVGAAVLRWQYFAMENQRRLMFMAFFNRLPGPVVWYGYGVVVLLVSGAGWLIFRTAFIERIQQQWLGIVERLRLIGLLYLVLDAVALMIIGFRNLV